MFFGETIKHLVKQTSKKQTSETERIGCVLVWAGSRPVVDGSGGLVVPLRKASEFDVLTEIIWLLSEGMGAFLDPVSPPPSKYTGFSPDANWTVAVS